MQMKYQRRSLKPRDGGRPSHVSGFPGAKLQGNQNSISGGSVHPNVHLRPYYCTHTHTRAIGHAVLPTILKTKRILNFQSMHWLITRTHTRHWSRRPSNNSQNKMRLGEKNCKEIQSQYFFTKKICHATPLQKRTFIFIYSKTRLN